MKKKFKSVAEMAQSLTKDNDFSKELEETIESKKIAKLLFSMRCSMNMSQEEMAQRLGCSQSKISKIEHSNNDELKVKDLIDYADILNLQLNINFASRQNPVVNRVKYHIGEIQKDLDYLTTIAKKDEKILEGVSNFCGEVLTNFLRMLQQTSSKLKLKKQAQDMIQVSSQLELKNSSKKELLSK